MRRSRVLAVPPSADTLRGAAAVLAALVTLLAPVVALACPYCAGRSDEGNPIMRGIVLGSFIFFPFGVAYTVLRVARAGHEGPAGESAEHPRNGDHR